MCSTFLHMAYARTHGFTKRVCIRTHWVWLVRRTHTHAIKHHVGKGSEQYHEEHKYRKVHIRTNNNGKIFRCIWHKNAWGPESLKSWHNVMMQIKPPSYMISTHAYIRCCGVHASRRPSLRSTYVTTQIHRYRYCSLWAFPFGLPLKALKRVC